MKVVWMVIIVSLSVEKLVRQSAAKYLHILGSSTRENISMMYLPRNGFMVYVHRLYGDVVEGKWQRERVTPALA